MFNKTKISKILPSAYELIGLIFLAIVAVLIGTSHQLLSYYGLESSKGVIDSDTGKVIVHGLGKLDGLGATDVVVTFLIWATVGIVCFSVVRAIMGTYQQIQHNKQLSSSSYVHPETFTKGKFWRQLILESIMLIFSLLLLALFVYGLLTFALPTAMAYSRTFLVGFSLSDIGNLLIGLAIVYVWLVFLDMCLRVVFHYRQLIATS